MDVLRQNVTVAEIELWAHLTGKLPLPEVVRTGADWIAYRYAEGITFQELKKTSSIEDIAEAARAMGRALAQIQTIPPSDGLTKKPPPELPDSPTLRQRLGGAETESFHDAIAEWMPRIRRLHEDSALVHGDFNNRNTILKREKGRWVVSAILDWETAFVGSPLWDVARFTCYENPLRPRREPHFSDGYREAGAKLPDDWKQFARAISAFSAAESLCRPDLPEQFVKELCELVIS